MIDIDIDIAFVGDSETEIDAHAGSAQPSGQNSLKYGINMNFQPFISRLAVFHPIHMEPIPIIHYDSECQLPYFST